MIAIIAVIALLALTIGAWAAIPGLDPLRLVVFALFIVPISAVTFYWLFLTWRERKN